MSNLASINDEEQLNEMLSQTQDFDERKKIRARLKELRDKVIQDWEARQKAAGKPVNAITRKHFEADLDKQKKLSVYHEAAKTQPESHGAPKEDPIKKKHREADLQKQKKLAAFNQQAKEQAEENRPDAAEEHRRQRQRDADAAKQRQMEHFDKMAKKEDVSQTRPAGRGRGSAKNMFQQMDAKTNPSGGAGRGGGLMRSPSAIKTMLLEWTKAMTREYRDVIEITNFSTSWNDGMAFCALIHHFYPEAFDFSALDPKERRKNFDLAFDTAEKYADIAPLLDTEDMVRMKKPDWKCVFTYVQSFYRKLQSHERNVAAAP